MRLFTAILLSMFAAGKTTAQSKSVEDRVQEFGQTVGDRLTRQFEAAGVEYPPTRLTFIGIKQDRVLEVRAAVRDEESRLICRYPILAASGGLGPKLREGDRQVPEGIYRVRELNPNSVFHLSIWLEYPNEFDWARAGEEGRVEPGSEIMIHGGDQSAGCLAVGDEAAEDLFVLAARVGIENVTVILTPVDFRRQSFAPLDGTPRWTAELYDRIA
ncbi:MAG: L,D-transpeptidase family protein, partial [Chthoniobacterales bacterium]|nr:L,D-transpeptidase family protein [Chthoniobacterales bacterium]